MQATKLERIKEGNPQAETEAEANPLMDDKMRNTGYSGRGLNPFKSAANASSERRASVEQQVRERTGSVEGSASPVAGFQKTTGTGLASPLLKAGWDADHRQGKSPMRKPAALELLVGDSQTGARGATPVRPREGAAVGGGLAADPSPQRHQRGGDILAKGARPRSPPRR